MQIINDFQAVGYSHEKLNSCESLKELQQDFIREKNQNQIIVGKGTGIGACMVF